MEQEEKVEDFYEVTVPRMNDRQFKEQFRLSRDTVDKVMDIITEADEAAGTQEAAASASVVSGKHRGIQESCHSVWYVPRCCLVRG